MEEKILLKTEKMPFAKICAAAVTVAIVIFCTILVITSLIGELYPEEIFGAAFGYALVFFILFLAIGSILNQSELTVSDKRAFGKVAFGKRVDLPLDSISSVGMGNLFKRLTVATSSGSLTFWYIQNLEEFHNVLSKLLIERQNNAKKSVEIKQEIPQSSADELRKYKDLLDSGIISQEEFDAKKKQLLGL